MIVTAKCLINSQFATTGSTLYTASSVRTIIDKFTAYNSDAGAVTVSIYIVPVSGTFGNSNAVMKTYSIASGATKDFSELQNQILESGDSIYVVASVGSKLAVRASGREVSA